MAAADVTIEITVTTTVRATTITIETVFERYFASIVRLRIITWGFWVPVSQGIISTTAAVDVAVTGTTVVYNVWLTVVMEIPSCAKTIVGRSQTSVPPTAGVGRSVELEAADRVEAALEVCSIVRWPTTTRQIINEIHASTTT